MFGILIPLLVGLAFGYFAKGRQDKSRLLRIGALWALVLAAVLNAIGWLAGRNPATGADEVSFWGIFLSSLASLGIFLAGVWIGDAIEARRARKALPPTGRAG